MLKLSVTEIIAAIEAEKPLEAVADDYSFTIKISEYAPYVCGAVHDGNQFRRSLWENCLHSEYDRWYEEDPCTKEMVRTHPVVIAGCDSRFEYDLNRGPESAIYDDAWGKALWKEPLPEHERVLSLEKHNAFYKVTHALISKIENIYGRAIVFDMHSYNWKRWDREVPVWNLGTTNIDNNRFGGVVNSWRGKLSKMRLPNGLNSSAGINDTFYGKGYFLKYITDHFKDTLVLATEIAKVYCDEHSGIIFPEVVHSVQEQLKELIPLQAEEFHQQKI